MKNFFKKSLTFLFYDYFLNIIEEEFNITIFLKTNGTIIKETTMKILPRQGDNIEINFITDNDYKVFKVEKVTITKFGSVAYLDGTIL